MSVGKSVGLTILRQIPGLLCGLISSWKIWGTLRTGRLKIYWLLPGKDIADGLRVIVGDNDTNVMAAVVDRFKNLVVYFDHDDSVVGVDWDDIVANPVKDLPKVISPEKVNSIPMNNAKLPCFYSDIGTSREHCNESEKRKKQSADLEDTDGGSDSSDREHVDFLDSDNEVDDGDDDLFVDYADANVIDEGVSKGKKAAGSRLKRGEAVDNIADYDEDNDDEDLLFPDDAAISGVRLNFKSWREEDTNNPTFRVCLVFPLVVVSCTNNMHQQRKSSCCCKEENGGWSFNKEGSSWKYNKEGCWSCDKKMLELHLGQIESGCFCD